LECGKKFLQKDGLIALGTIRPLVKALGHPVRVAIVLQLSTMGELSPSRISQRIGEDLPTVAYHMKVLRGLDPPAVKLTEERPVRGATEHFYRINA
jgi:DNA-binding transcriptional ArsR family regulator